MNTTGLVRLVEASGEPAPITEPFTGDLLEVIPQMTPGDIDRIFDRARSAQPAWAAVPVVQRARLVGKLLDLIYKRRETFLDLLQREGGKARIDALVELGEALLATRHHVNTAAALLETQTFMGPIPGLSSARVVHQPHGVVLVIVPWNFPVALGAVDSLPALIAGNSVILKADNQTALSLLALRQLAIEVGIPPGAFQIALGRREDIGDALIDATDYVAFTGSTAAGRQIARRAGERLIGCSLELGGKNPMIVLPDADLDRAASALRRASFANAGQLCMTVERLYVHEDVIDEFTELAVVYAAQIRLGARLSFDADMGSITTDANFTRLQGFVDQAVSSGASVLTGGLPRPDLGPQFYEPTILRGVTEDARLHTEEVFGPVVSIYPFSTADEAVALANDTPYGLSASVWTRDIKTGEQLAQQIRAGGVNVNDGYAAAFGTHAAPAGGMKGSGVGRRHGSPGLLRYTEAQTVAIQRVASVDSRFGLSRGMHGEFAARALGLLKFLR